MAKTVVRKNLKQFGVNGNSNNFGQFGSVDAGSPLKTKAIETIQALSAWLTGWQDAVISGNKAPFLEDMNGAMLVMFYELFYVLQEGVAEWNVDTTYFVGSMARKPGSNQVYQSLTDDNLANALPDQTDNTNWHFMYPVRFTDLLGSIAIGQIPDALITNAKIISMAASKLTGLVINAQIQDLGIDKLVGGPLGIGLGGTQGVYKIVGGNTYTGDGTASRNVDHNLQGAVPDIIVISQSNNGTQTPEFWGSNFPANTSRDFNGNVRSDGIKGANATVVTLGASATVNGAGLPYILLALKFQVNV